jgi:hypothetical protein
MALAGMKISNFWPSLASKKQGGSTPLRPVKAPCEAPAPACDLTGPNRASWAPPEPSSRAEDGQYKRRSHLQAQKLADTHIPAIRGGHYAYRVLKDDFDQACYRAGLVAVSDKCFAGWLQAHGGRKYRCNYPKTTMYQMPRRRSARRQEATQELRC